MKRAIIACLIILPFVASATITVNAPSQDGAWAVLFNPDTGSVYNQVQFANGVATIDATALGGGSTTTRWAVDVTYDAAKSWQTYNYVSTASGYSRGVTGWDAANHTINVVSGEITSRSYTTNSGDRSISVTYSGNTAGPVTLGTLNNDTNQLDAMLKVYRPVLSNPYTPGYKRLTWDSSTLSLGYTVDTVAYDGTLDLITVSKNDGTFTAQYLGENLGGTSYSLLFTAYDDPGDTAYWTTSDNGGGANGVVTNPDGSVTFTAHSSSTAALDDAVPYYVMMDYSQIFSSDGDVPLLDYMARGQDNGVHLTNPDYYVIPEPAVVTLIGSAGIMLLFGRRFFRA